MEHLVLSRLVLVVEDSHVDLLLSISWLDRHGLLSIVIDVNALRIRYELLRVLDALRILFHFFKF